MSAFDAAILYIAHGAQPVLLHGIVDGKCTCGKTHEKKSDGNSSTGKHPILNNWQKNIATDEISLRDQFSRIKVKEPNIGLVLGHQPNGDYLIAIDKDDEERFDQLTGEYGPLPKTPRCDSGRGHRLFYRLPVGIPTERLKNVTGIGGAPGVDAKVKGGQVVVAPSMHFLGGVYSWVENTMGVLAELPMTWVDALIAEPMPPPFAREYTPETIRADDRAKRKLERYLERAVIEECSRLARMPEGLRNTYLHRKAVSLLSLVNGCFLPARWGYVLSELDKAARAAGLDSREVRKTLTSAENYVTREGATRGPRPESRRAEPTSPPSECPQSSRNGVASHATASVEPPSSDTWKRGLLMRWLGNGQQVVRPIAANVAHILSTHPDWRSLLAYDELRECVVKLRPAPCREIDRAKIETREYSDDDTRRTIAWLSEVVGIDCKKEIVDDAVQIVAATNPVHEVRDYLRALKWDGVERLPTMLSTYFGTKQSEYTAGVGVRWMISAVARAMRPGCQVDCVLILESPHRQGPGKTSGFRALVPPSMSPHSRLYADSGIVIGNKDSMENLRGVWIYGFDELDSLKGGELTRHKTFITQTTDRFRPAFGRRARDFPRQNIFCGSTDKEVYLEDGAGNRRFWPSRVETTVDVEAICRDRDQLWAEAMVRFHRPEAWHVDTPEFRALCESEQADRVTPDDWEPIVAAWLRAPGTILGERVDISSGVLTADVLEHALRMQPRDITKAHSMRVAGVLRSLGFERTQKTEPDPVNLGKTRKFWRYVRRVEPPPSHRSEVVPPGGSTKNNEVTP
jgi:predicted P-loop ATPase